MISVAEIVVCQMLLDLRTRAMHQHQPDAERRKQVEVMCQFDKFSVGNHLTAKGNDKSLAAECVDVRRDGTEPGNEVNRGGGSRHYGISLMEWRYLARLCFI